MTDFAKPETWMYHRDALKLATEYVNPSHIAQACRLLCESALPLTTLLEVSNLIAAQSTMMSCQVTLATHLRVGALPHLLRLFLAADGLAMDLTIADPADLAVGKAGEGCGVLLLDRWSEETAEGLSETSSLTIGLLNDQTDGGSALLPGLEGRDSFVVYGDGLFDARLSALGVRHISYRTAVSVAAEIAKRVRSQNGRSRKLILSDLDGVLWPGVLGEIGPQGVWDGSPSLEPYRALQGRLSELAASGQVQLTILSKNNREDVEAAFLLNPDMPLRLDDFVQVDASWTPKPDVAKTTLEALNTSAAHGIFLDDNPAEQIAMREALPDLVIPGCANDAAQLLAQLKLMDWTWTGIRTHEDSLRAASLVARDIVRQQAAFPGDLATLGMQARVLSGAQVPLSRAVQLYRRVTQFNTVGEILDEAAVAHAIAQPDHLFMAFDLRDSLADHGIVALCHARVSDRNVIIEQILMSCRVMGRGLETLVLMEVARRAEELGCNQLTGRVRCTARNEPVLDLFERHHFECDWRDTDVSLWTRQISNGMNWPQASIELARWTDDDL